MAVVADSAASVLDRLKNKAKETGISYQVMLQLFCQEEILRRVARSSYAHNLVLKGGLFIYCLCGFESRPTIDMDFLLRRQNNAPDEAEQMIKKIIGVDTGNNFITFDIKKVEPIAEHREYSGVRIQMIGIIKNTRSPFDIDLGTGDVIVPRSEKRVINTLLPDFENPDIYTYSIESTIAEKLDVIISRMELTSRMKDFYDIYFLANKFNFDGRRLQEAIFETLQNRGTTYDRDIFISIVNFSEQDDMNMKWRYFLRKLGAAQPAFREVLRLFDTFLQGIFNAVINETEFFGMWDKDKLKWT